MGFSQCPSQPWTREYCRAFDRSSWFNFYWHDHEKKIFLKKNAIPDFLHPSPLQPLLPQPVGLAVGVQCSACTRSKKPSNVVEKPRILSRHRWNICPSRTFPPCPQTPNSMPKLHPLPPPISEPCRAGKRGRLFTQRQTSAHHSPFAKHCRFDRIDNWFDFPPNATLRGIEKWSTNLCMHAHGSESFWRIYSSLTTESDGRAIIRQLLVFSNVVEEPRILSCRSLGKSLTFHRSFPPVLSPTHQTTPLHSFLCPHGVWFFAAPNLCPLLSICISICNARHLKTGEFFPADFRIENVGQKC